MAAALSTVEVTWPSSVTPYMNLAMSESHRQICCRVNFPDGNTPKGDKSILMRPGRHTGQTSMQSEFFAANGLCQTQAWSFLSITGLPFRSVGW